MTRSILAGLAAAVGLAIVSGTGCQTTGVGDPCTPEAEYDKSFLGFDESEVEVESKSFQCLTRLCLVNHFQGRVSCPYGQDTNGMPIPPASQGCLTPGVGTAVDGIDATGMQVDKTKKAAVEPQCLLRTADKAVYCSCRCANVDGNQNDGAVYCTCPDGYDCTQLVSSIGTTSEGLTGGYCIKHGTLYDQTNPCGGTCDPNAKNCGNAQGITVM
ncbi:MAG TPA: hypothetical protein VKU41_02885 [Polyangiaceae bacterium]|nr:hypothetical protein [Polyangiaceae bacterium]